MASATLLALAPVLSVGIFAKTWWRETINKTVANRYQFMETFMLLLRLLTLCYLAERVPTQSINTTRRNVVLLCMFSQLDYKCQLETLE